MANERDTHFAGFAKLLFDELDNLKEVLFGAGYIPGNYEPGNYERIVQKIIAQRAYDLFYHVMEHAQDGVYYPPEEWLGHVPDLTVWPDTAPPTLGEIQEALKSIPGVTEWLNTSPEAL